MTSTWLWLSLAIFTAWHPSPASSDRSDLWSGQEALHHDKGWYSSDTSLLKDSLHGASRQLHDRTHVPLAPLHYAAAWLVDNKPQNRTNIAQFDLTTAQLELVGGGGGGGGPRSALIRRRCRHTRGKWCGRFIVQTPVPVLPTPRGSKQCQNNCNGVGNCNHDLGVCDCPAGWTGQDCTTPDKRPCGNGMREVGSKERQNHTDKDGRDRNWLEDGWSASRCAGICDDDLAMCWCDGKHKRIPAPPGSPPGTPPLQRGRPLSEFCGKVREDKDGKKTSWGNVHYKTVYGPNGWCEADIPGNDGMCDNCQLDNLDGKFCDVIKEAYCPTQCSGHGECNLGFCKCREGWYGTDCSRKVAGAAMEPGDAESGAKPWLKRPGLGQLPLAARPEFASQPSATTSTSSAAAQTTRLRPLIYVYDVPPPYTTRMLQYRLVWKACIWRHFSEKNETLLHDWLYGVETYFHEQLLGSPHRTFDPEEADFFYVPLYVTCYFWPIIGWSDHPWWYAPESISRPMHGANMMLELKRWLESAFPFWKRRGGRDHIWLVAADEGACWMPTEIYNTSIILTHWGRLDENHQSGTAFFRDVYDRPYETQRYPEFTKPDWRELYRNHTCYNPKKDLVIPSLKLPSHYAASPLLGSEPYHRDIRLFFKGDVGAPPREARYSRGIRQKLYQLHKEQDWRKKHAIYILGPEEDGGQYTQLLARSVFCLVAPGDGWSARAEDAVLHGCLPFIIMDNVHTVFESILEWDAFSIRIKEASIPHIPAILSAITDDQIARMQRRLGEVWHRFAYATGTLLQNHITNRLEENLRFQPGTQNVLPDTYPVQRLKEFPFQDDAFGTIMAWLHSRIPDVKKGRESRAAGSVGDEL